MIKITNQKIWQVGTGNSTRDYSKFCMDFGIAIVGPGKPGDARDPNTEEFYKTSNYNDWGKYLYAIRLNDIVLLRRGQTIIKAVGVVTKEYDYSESLSDVHGWDLNHYIGVEWYINKDGKDIVLPSAMIGYSTMSEVTKNYNFIKELIEKINLKRYNKKYSIDNLKIPRPISYKDITDYLINHGIRITDAINITNTISRIVTLVDWYIKNDPDVLEHELRTFLVIPFLLSLGWSEQKIKVEYNQIDVALFKKPFIQNEEQQPSIIIETKSFNDGLLFAKNQVKYYSEKYPKCQKVITTNGYRYCIYIKDGKEFIFYSYVNLLDMREFDYVDNNIKGTLESLIEISNF